MQGHKKKIPPGGVGQHLTYRRAQTGPMNTTEWLLTGTGVALLCGALTMAGWLLRLRAAEQMGGSRRARRPMRLVPSAGRTRRPRRDCLAA